VKEGYIHSSLAKTQVYLHILAVLLLTWYMDFGKIPIAKATGSQLVTLVFYFAIRRSYSNVVFSFKSVIFGSGDLSIPKKSKGIVRSC
jgi:hypothetical protein